MVLNTFSKMLLIMRMIIDMDKDVLLIEGGEVVQRRVNREGEEVDEYGVAFKGYNNLWRKDTVEFYSFFDILEQVSKKFKRLNSHLGYKERKKAASDVSLAYFVTDLPVSWDLCQANLAAESLGIPLHVAAHAHYSDLTGFLWMNYYAENQSGHDVFAELSRIKSGKYLTLKCEIPKLD